MTSLQTAAAAFGGLLAARRWLLSGLARRSVLSLAALFVLAGFLLGDGALGVLHFKASSGFVTDLATVALIVILFRDGLEVEGELLQSHWQLPLRKLAIGMPITAIGRYAAGTRADRAELDRGIPAGRAALPHRPGAVLGRGH